MNPLAAVSSPVKGKEIKVTYLPLGNLMALPLAPVLGFAGGLSSLQIPGHVWAPSRHFFSISISYNRNSCNTMKQHISECHTFINNLSHLYKQYQHMTFVPFMCRHTSQQPNKSFGIYAPTEHFSLEWKGANVSLKVMEENVDSKRGSSGAGFSVAWTLVFVNLREF